MAALYSIRRGSGARDHMYSQPEVDAGECQGTPERFLHDSVLHRLQEGLRLSRL